jgi:aspartyl/asparaginyl-tRNA synthetase
MINKFPKLWVAGSSPAGDAIYSVGSMDKREFSGHEILSGQAPQDMPVTTRGWVRTRRDSRAGISFVHLSDGSSFHPLQVVAPNSLPNYEGEVLKLTAGCAVEATGMIVPSPAKGQPFEMQASALRTDRCAARLDMHILDGHQANVSGTTGPKIESGRRTNECRGR